MLCFGSMWMLDNRSTHNTAQGGGFCYKLNASTPKINTQNTTPCSINSMRSQVYTGLPRASNPTQITDACVVMRCCLSCAQESPCSACRMIHAAMMDALSVCASGRAWGTDDTDTVQHGLQLLDEELPRSMTNSRCRIVPCKSTV